MTLYVGSIIACAVTTWAIIRDEIKRGRTR